VSIASLETPHNVGASGAYAQLPVPVPNVPLLAYFILIGQTAHGSSSGSRAGMWIWEEDFQTSKSKTGGYGKRYIICNFNNVSNKNQDAPRYDAWRGRMYVTKALFGLGLCIQYGLTALEFNGLDMI